LTKERFAPGVFPEFPKASAVPFCQRGALTNNRKALGGNCGPGRNHPAMRVSGNFCPTVEIFADQLW
jgi:hypothetical protein